MRASSKTAFSLNAKIKQSIRLYVNECIRVYVIFVNKETLKNKLFTGHY